MNLSVGIVGLPNVGKSTLFNVLLKRQQAFVANYPFATIEPNVGVVPVPDERLERLAEIIVEEEKPHPDPLLEGEGTSISPSPSRKREGVRERPPIKPATVKFVDIAGLVKGANKGAGLGNKFLAHIREASVIGHVVRVFEDENVVKEGSTDPKSDYETIQTEFILADLDSISNIKNQKSKISPVGRQLKSQNFAKEKIETYLNKGIPVRDVGLTDEEKEAVKDLFLLTAKPEIVVLNVGEEDYNTSGSKSVSQKYKKILKPSNSAGRRVQHDKGNNIIVICAKIEAELAELSGEDQKQYLKDLGFGQSGLERLIKKAYETLGLISFFTTTGGKEVRAWTIKKGTDAIQSAGEIHTDFQKKFIKAEVLPFDDFVKHGGWKGSREKGKTRFEGRDYIVEDGDVVEFKIGT